MGWPKLLVLVRHAQSIGNVMTPEERAACPLANWDYPLTDRGREQAAITGHYLRERFDAFDIHYSSPYLRAKQTMQIMFPDVKIYEDSRLSEYQTGIWSVFTEEQIRQYYPLEIERKKREGYYFYRPIGGENNLDVEIRKHSWLGTLKRDCADKKVIITLHGHGKIILQKLLHHFSIEEATRRIKHAVSKNASVCVYKNQEIDGQSRLVLIEDDIIPWKEKL